MKKILINSTLLILLISSLLTVGYKNSVAQVIESYKKEKTIKLFNGRNLDGWYKFIKDRGRDNDPKNVFTVANGTIEISGEEYGCITTNVGYENYELIAEFKWAGITFPPRLNNARDGGILLHSQGVDGGYGGIWMNSIECQIIEGGTGDIIVVGNGSKDFSVTSNVKPGDKKGSYFFNEGGQSLTFNSGRIDWHSRDFNWEDKKDFRGKQDIEKPVGQWNTLKCVVYKGNLSIFLNGVLVNRATNLRPTIGRIQVQSEGAGILFRRIDLTPLHTKPRLGKKLTRPTLLVANKHSNTLSFVNPKTFQIIETIPTGPNPHEIAITPDQRFAYLSSYEPPGNTISVIDLVNRKMIKQIPTGKYIRIHGAAVALDGKNAYFTAGQSGYVVEIDTRTNEITRTIPTHGKISHMVYISPDSKRLYTTNIVSENVSVIDRASGELITQIKCGGGGDGLAFTPDGKYFWVTSESGGTITIIDAATNTPIEIFNCPGHPVRIRFTADGKLALVPGWVKEGTLTIVDVATRKEIKRIRVGNYAIGVELSPNGRYAFVGCEDSMEAEILPDGSERIRVNTGDSDGIHVIDMKTLAVVAVIKTGLGPDPMSMWYPPNN